MKSHIERNVLVAFGVAVLLLIVVSVITFDNTLGLINTSHQVADRHARLTQLEAILLTATEAEDAAHSYMIFGQDSYLPIYRAAVERMDDEVSTLEQLGGGDAELLRQIPPLRDTITQRLGLLQQAIQLRQEGGLTARSSEIEAIDGKAAMDKVRTQIDALEQTQRDLLKTGAAASEAKSQATVATLIVLGLLMIVLLGLVFVLIRRDVTERQDAHRLIQVFNERLQQSNRDLQDFASVASHDLQELSSTVGSEAWNSRDLKSRPH